MFFGEAGASPIVAESIRITASAAASAAAAAAATAEEAYAHVPS